MIRARDPYIAGASDMSIRFVSALLLAGLLLGGCSGSSSDGIGPTNPNSGNGNPTTPGGVGVFKANFVPLSGVLPFPTDLYFNGSTDGTLNMPSTPFLPNAAAMNALDGYSTNAAATARFSAPINPATISPASVYMFEVDVDNATKATVGFRRPLAFGTDFTARVATTFDSGGATLEILPLKPLTPSTGATNVGYLIILTNGLEDVDGNAATPDADYLAIKNAQPTCAAITNASLNGICRLTGAHLAIASAVLTPAIVPTIVLTFSFSTQATADSMNYAALLAQPTPIGVVATGLNLQALNPALPPIADVYVGTLEIPYYHDPAAPLSGSWHGAPFTAVPGAATTTHLTRFNPVPVKQADLDIPLFVTVPNAASGQVKPVAGWPVVIFQHGLQGNRTQSAAIAGAYAAQGFVVAAIDIPLHGITDTTSPLYQGPNERTFNLDLVNNTTGAQGADGVIDPSGSYIINLTSLLTSRDNLREAAIDIVQLATSLPSLDLDGDTVADIDAARIHYSSISLGGIVGTVANAMPISTVSAYLNVPGGGVANLLRESAALGPSVIGGLENAGLIEGTTLFEQFFRDAQAIVDAGDPVNYIATTIAARPVLLSQVINDTVVPNSATQRLINAATFVKASAAGPTPVGAGTGTWVHFTSGSHGSLLSPAASLAVTTEMQTHAASLAASGGAAFVITNPGILEP
jgi:platelet-activating factor acetylhydrolase isoform II/virulence factor lipase-like protein